MAPRVTLKDLARETGMSPAAISQVLNGRPCRISEENKQRIKDMAKALNYRVNRVARGLATARLDTIGLIVPDIENPFFSSFAKQVELSCRRRGFSLVITNTDDKTERDCEELVRLETLGLDGLIFVPSTEFHAQPDDELVEVLENLSIPYVMADRLIDQVSCDKVGFDNTLGAYQMTNYLIGQGHRRIGLLVNSACSENGRDRLRGYKRGLEEHNIVFDEGLIANCLYKSDSGYEMVDALLETDATVLFSTSDIITIGMMRRLAELRIRVPQDISVASFDRNEASPSFMPEITSVCQDVPSLARSTFEVLFERLQGKDSPFERLILEPSLCLASSVALRSHTA